jgi:hypothetical protein
MYSVEWLESALNDLAAEWTQADAEIRQAITDATNMADQQLEQDPYANSESRPQGRRIMFVSPLALLYRVEENLGRLTVIHVWTFRMRN